MDSQSIPEELDRMINFFYSVLIPTHLCIGVSDNKTKTYNLIEFMSHMK